MNETFAEQESCFHCGLPSFAAFRADIQGKSYEFCCIGCQSVALTIHGSGLASFYQYRDHRLEKPNGYGEQFGAYDLDEVQNDFVFPLNQTTKRVRIYVGGVTCAACAWLIEHYLAQMPGITHVRVNVSSLLCEFEWDSNTVKLSEVFIALTDIGYRPKPGVLREAQSLRKKELSSILRRMGVAGLGMMQVGMVAIALHAGNIQGIESNWQHFLRWVSLVFATPIMLYSAQPFFISAWRSIKCKHVNMDVSVSLALLLAFSSSVLATGRNTGEVYFDSVAMFTFFLLVGRYLTVRVRHKNAVEIDAFSSVLPFSVDRVLALDNEKKTAISTECIPLKALQPGDTISVQAGEVIPCDGQLVNQAGSVDESLLTGESVLIKKQQGSEVLAGSVVGDTSILIKTMFVADNTRLSAIERLVHQASQHKPVQQQMADRIAGKFIVGVLCACLLVYIAWTTSGSDKAFWIMLSVLVVTCPCALSLATPAALAAGLNGLRQRGLLILSADGLSTLANINHIVFDKTGTLTQGAPRVTDIVLIDEKESTYSHEEVLQIIAALETHSRHPIATAFQHISSPFLASGVSIEPGLGISGEIQMDGQNHLFRFGLEKFACPTFRGNCPSQDAWQLLACDNKAIAWVLLRDDVREGAVESILACVNEGLQVSILSGDRQGNLDRFVSEHLRGKALVDFDEIKGELLPEQKLDVIKTMQKDGARVMMVGDGINDVPVLAIADFSVAMNSAAQLARINADAVLLCQRLPLLIDSLRHAKRVARVIRQNLAWAIGYNALALPVAALGYIPPYIAAIGMSISSLVVVINSLRLHSVRKGNCA